MLFILAVQRTVKLPIPSDVKYLRKPLLLLGLDHDPDLDSQNLFPPHPALQHLLPPREVELVLEIILEFNLQNLPLLLNLQDSPTLDFAPGASHLTVGV